MKDGARLYSGTRLRSRFMIAFLPVCTGISDDSEYENPWLDNDVFAVRDVFFPVSEMYKTVAGSCRESLSQDKHTRNPRAARIDE